MSFLLDLPEEIASELTGAVGQAFEFMGNKIAELGAALEALSARLDDEDADTTTDDKAAPAAAPPAAPPTS